jgi:imidazole glycerol-phosphate synthase subunit HisF
VFYDITASAEHRPIDIQMVKAVARNVFVPFAVGGGISKLEDMERVLLSGAEKVSVNTLAVENPDIIAQGARAFGSQCIVIGMDPVKINQSKKFPSGYEITTHGFRKRANIDAVEWAKKTEQLGCGEIVVNSVNADGTKTGFNIELTGLIAQNVSVPVVASGGAGNAQHLADAFIKANADAAIVAGILHSGEWTIADIKKYLISVNIPIRKTW